MRSEHPSCGWLRLLSRTVCSGALTACGGAAPVGDNLDVDQPVTRAETPTRLVDYAGDVPDAGRSAVQIPTIALASDDLFYVLNWNTPLGAPEGPGGYLLRVALGGGTPVRMAGISGGGSQSGQGLVVTQAAAIFSEARDGLQGGEGAIVSVPTGGGEPTTLALTTGVANALVADDRNLYFVDGAGTKSVPLTGGSVRTLTNQMPFSIMVAGSTLYLAEYAPSGEVSSVPTGGGPVVVLATEPNGAIHPIRCGKNLCWLTGPPLKASLKQLDANGNVTMLATGLNQPHDLVFDGKNFFVSAGGGGFLLLRIPAAGGQPIVIQADGGLSSLAINDACLYWSSASGIYGWALSTAGAATGVSP